MATPLEPKRSVSRLLVEKLGSRSVDEFKGNAGEVFFDPAVPGLWLSNGPTEAPTSIVGDSTGAPPDAGISVPQNLGSLPYLNSSPS